MRAFNPIFAIVAAICVLFVSIFVIKMIHIKQKLYSGWGPSNTFSRMMTVASACDEYNMQAGQWPSSLSELHYYSLPFPSQWCTDAWTHPIILVPYTNSLGYGKILSYGRDGKVGGAGEDRDIEVRFPVEANSNWNDQERNEFEYYRPQP